MIQAQPGNQELFLNGEPYLPSTWREGYYVERYNDGRVEIRDRTAIDGFDDGEDTLWGADRLEFADKVVRRWQSVYIPKNFSPAFSEIEWNGNRDWADNLGNLSGDYIDISGTVSGWTDRDFFGFFTDSVSDIEVYLGRFGDRNLQLRLWNDFDDDGRLDAGEYHISYNGKGQSEYIFANNLKPGYWTVEVFGSLIGSTSIDYDLAIATSTAIGDYIEDAFPLGTISSGMLWNNEIKQLVDDGSFVIVESLGWDDPADSFAFSLDRQKLLSLEVVNPDPLAPVVGKLYDSDLSLVSDTVLDETIDLEPGNYFLVIENPNLAGNFLYELSGSLQELNSAIFVDDDWSGLAPGISVEGKIVGETAFSDIQSAINVSNPGAVIEVMPGNYETVYITKPLSLRGPNYGKSGNDEQRTQEAQINRISFLPGASDGEVIIDGFFFSVNLSESASIEITNAGNQTTIRNNIFRNLSADAIRNFPNHNTAIQDTTQLKIENNLIDGITGNHSRRAIFLQEISDVTILGNYLRNVAGGDNPGILLDTVTGTVIVENNYLSDIASQGIQVAGITDGGTVTIRNNELENINIGPDGIASSGDEDISNAGIRLRDSPYGSLLSGGTIAIEGNIIKNSLNGIVVRNAANASNLQIADNFFVDNVHNPGGASSSFSFGNLPPGYYAIINGGTGEIDITDNFKDLTRTVLIEAGNVFN